jgi:hypothetical protein
VAYAVAQETGIVVAGVLEGNNSLLAAVEQRFRVRHLKQGAQQIAAAGDHANEACQAAAAQPVKEQRLHLVIGVMGEGDEAAARHSTQKTVASHPPRLLQRAAF